MIPASPVIPQPEPLPLPAPGWLLWFLLMLTLTLHVVAMNLLLGGTFLALYARVRHAANVHVRELLVHMAKPMPVVAAATVTLGVAPLLFLQVLFGRVFFTSSVLMAWAWLAVVPALLAAYYGTYAIVHRIERLGVAPTWLYAAVTAVLATIGLLYTTNMTLMLGAERFGALYAASGRGLHMNFSDPTLVPRWLHMVTGAIAVAGLALATAGFAAGTGSPPARIAREFGTRAAAIATGVNLVVGFVFAALLPSGTLQRFIGGSFAATALMLLSAVLGLLTFVLLVLLTQQGATKRLAWLAVSSMALTIVGMLLVRDQVRTAALERIGFQPVAWISPQWGPFGLFALLLVAALGTVAWMVFALMRSKASEDRIAPAA